MMLSLKSKVLDNKNTRIQSNIRIMKNSKAILLERKAGLNLDAPDTPSNLNKNKLHIGN